VRQEQAIKLQEQARSARRLRLLLLLASLAAVAALIFAASAIFSSRRAAVLAVERDLQAGTAQANAGTAQANAGIALAAGEQAIVERSTAVAASTQANLERARAQVAQGTAEAAGQEALAQKAIAEAQSRLATSRQLAAQAQGYLGSDPSLAALLGIEAYRITDTLEAKSVLLSSLQASLSTTLQEFGRPIPKEKSDVVSVAVSPDGVHMAWGTQEGSLVVWDYQTQTLVRRLAGHLGAVEALSFSPDGSRLASGGDDYRLYLWEVGSWERTQLVGAVNSVKSLVFSPDGRRLAAGVGTEVTIWDLDTQQVARKMERQIDFIRSLAWSPEGAALASGGEDGRIIVWDPDTGEASLRFPRQAGAIYGLDWSPDGNFLASAGEGGLLTVWDKETGKAAGAPITAHKGRPVYDVAYSPDGRLLASGGGDNSVSFFDAHTFKPVARLENYHINSIRSLAFRPALGQILLATASLDDTAGLHIVNLQQPLNEVLASDKGDIFGLANGSQGELLIAAWDAAPASLGEPRPITVWELRQGNETQWFQLPAEAVQAALSPDGKKLAVEAPDGAIRLLELPSGQEINNFGLSGALYNELAFSSDGNYLAASVCTEETIDRASRNRCLLSQIHIWGIDGSRLQTAALEAHDFLNSLAFNETFRYLAGDEGGSILLWWFVEGGGWAFPTTSHLPLSPEIGLTSSLAFSPEGSSLASGHSNNLLVLWDLTAFRQIGGPLFGAQAEITSLVFSPDGAALISGSQDGQVLRWDISPQSWVERNCKLAGRNLTPEEWQQFFPGIPEHQTCPES
jgi:WD40 repeat protein